GAVCTHADHSPKRAGVRVLQVPDEHVEALLVRHPGRRRRAPGPRFVSVLQGVGDDAVDLHAVRDARLLETVGPGALHTVGAHTVGRRERVRPARKAAEDATAGVVDVEPQVTVFVLET